MSNPWTRLSKLIAPGAKTIVTVTTVHTDGTSTVTLRSGDTLRVQGDTVAASSKAIIQAGRIIGKAPDLSHYEIEV
ncbi:MULTISPECIES: hypothetical protein [unclassified Oceanobacter]|uniref:hypothetical protein n=1 Tax=unclassified Oceanobacter TaxID=2620260 RepID=UPI002734BFC6|nr:MULTISPECIES: hypothetical protein [unclassified Oceanobacter]MDP2610015.1 hypothetical protein [Oceanobacter sp. 1_MG-2023]MDP2613349.1 hypothetical protein [Oceanobacter sp. 2_MG-2023]